MNFGIGELGSTARSATACRLAIAMPTGQAPHAGDVDAHAVTDEFERQSVGAHVCTADCGAPP